MLGMESILGVIVLAIRDYGRENTVYRKVGQCLCRRKERAGVISILVSVYNVKQMLWVGYRIIVCALLRGQCSA